MGTKTNVAIALAVGALATTGVGAADAASGGALLLGHNNTAHKTTTITDHSGTPLALKGSSRKPPLSVNSNRMVKKLNAEFLNGLTADELIPHIIDISSSLTAGTGTATCPDGTTPTGGGVVPDVATGVHVVASGTHLTGGDPDGWTATVAADTGVSYDGGGQVDVECVIGFNLPPSASASSSSAAAKRFVRLAQREQATGARRADR